MQNRVVISSLRLGFMKVIFPVYSELSDHRRHTLVSEVLLCALFLAETGKREIVLWSSWPVHFGGQSRHPAASLSPDPAWLLESCFPSLSQGQYGACLTRYGLPADSKKKHGDIESPYIAVCPAGHRPVTSHSAMGRSKEPEGRRALSHTEVALGCLLVQTG